MCDVDRSNPFTREPVRSPGRFFGREANVSDAIRFLARGQNVAVDGPAAVGKTSFLSYVAHRAKISAHEPARKRTFVVLDGRSLAERGYGHFCLAAVAEIAERALAMPSLDEASRTSLEGATSDRNSTPPFLRLKDTCRVAQGVGMNLVLVLDDLEDLASRFSPKNRLFPGLRSLSDSYRVVYFVASQLSLYEIERTTPEASPFFNTFHRVRLGPFAESESRELVRRSLSRVEGVEFPLFAIQWILDRGENKPAYLQRAGHIVFQVWQERGERLQQADLAELGKRFDSER